MAVEIQKIKEKTGEDQKTNSSIFPNVMDKSYFPDNIQNNAINDERTNFRLVQQGSYYPRKRKKNIINSIHKMK